MSGHEGGASKRPSAERGNPRSWLRRLLWNIAGTIFLGLGLIGAALPVMPTTPFLLLAAACYLNGSTRMYEWMTKNRLFGRYLRDYMEGRGVPLRTKIASICFLWLAISASILLVVDDLVIQAILLVIAASVTIHILRIKTKR